MLLRARRNRVQAWMLYAPYLALLGFGGGFLGSLFGGSGLGSLFGGGSGASASPSIFSGIYHDGGLVGAGAAGRMIPALAFAGAPRLHDGAYLRPDEVPAILQRGERVLHRAEARAYDAGRGSAGPPMALTFNVTTPDAFVVPTARPSGFYTFGVCTFLSGANAGAAVEVLGHVGQAVTLFTPMPRPITAGDQVRLIAGCDETIGTCHARFGNVLNFRGEPHIPGNDKVFSYPVKD